MPITIQHTPATLVGTLAAQVGMAQGQLRERERTERIQELRYQQYSRRWEQETAGVERALERQRVTQERALDRQLRQQESRMSRDMQLTQMMMASQERGASEAAARVAQREAFRFQSALAAQRARAIPGGPDARAQRQDLHRAVDEAETSGAYTPAQIKRMRIRANMNDRQGVRMGLSERDRPTPSTQKERELKRQLTLVKKHNRIDAEKLQKELTTVNQKMLKEPNSAAIIAERDEIVQRIIAQEESATRQERRLEEGYTLSEQDKIDYQRALTERLRVDKLAQIEAIAVSKRNREREKTARNRFRRDQKVLRAEISREMRLLENLDPYSATYETDKNRIKKRIQKLRDQEAVSYARQDAAMRGAVPTIAPKGSTPSENIAAENALLLKYKGNLEAAKLEMKRREREKGLNLNVPKIKLPVIKRISAQYRGGS